MKKWIVSFPFLHRYHSGEAFFHNNVEIAGGSMLNLPFIVINLVLKKGFFCI